MRLSNKFTAGLLAGAFTATTAIAGPVITWVPPYSVGTCKTKLQANWGGFGMKDGLTYLALQWWVCDGPNIKPWGGVPNFDTNVKWFVDWGKANGVKVTLCVVNHVGDWNCPEARRSFIDNRPAFVKSLVAEANRRGGLDNITCIIVSVDTVSEPAASEARQPRNSGETSAPAGV